MTDPDTILLETEDHMTKAVGYLASELKGLRGGRASTALVEFLKVEYYGAPTDLKSIASVSIPEPTQLLIKPFDAAAVSDIRKAIETSDLGMAPIVDGKVIRLNVPPLSTDRRKQLVAKAKKLGEEAKIVLRNTRRDANKHADGLAKGGATVSEDEVETLKEEIQELLKQHEAKIDAMIEDKSKEILEV